MEEALELIYRGQCNVAVEGKRNRRLNQELKRLFRVYAMQRLSMRMFGAETWN